MVRLLSLVLLTLSFQAFSVDIEVFPVSQRLSLSLVETADHEQKTRYWSLVIKSPENCACSRCSLENSVEKKGNEYVFTVGKVVPPQECLEPASPAEVSVKITLEDQKEYFVSVNGEKYRAQVTPEFAELRAIAQKTKRLTKPESKYFYRPITNLVSLLCFRYTYPCDKGKNAVDELCPKLFSAMKAIAEEADMNRLVKRGQTLDCTEEYRRKGKCKLYYFNGPVSELKKIYDNTESYRLPRGLTSRCESGEPPLYYKKIRTWDDQEVCC